VFPEEVLPPVLLFALEVFPPEAVGVGDVVLPVAVLPPALALAPLPLQVPGVGELVFPEVTPGRESCVEGCPFEDLGPERTVWVWGELEFPVNAMFPELAGFETGVAEGPSSTELPSPEAVCPSIGFESLTTALASLSS
jgi:hypothetical protein